MEVAGTTAVVIVVGVAAGAIVAAVIAAVASASTVFTTIGVLWGVGGITLTCAKLLAKKNHTLRRWKINVYAIFILAFVAGKIRTRYSPQSQTIREDLSVDTKYCC